MNSFVSVIAACCPPAVRNALNYCSCNDILFIFMHCNLLPVRDCMSVCTGKIVPVKDAREVISRRVAKEFKNGYYANLGAVPLLCGGMVTFDSSFD